MAVHSGDWGWACTGCARFWCHSMKADSLDSSFIQCGAKKTQGTAVNDGSLPPCREVPHRSSSSSSRGPHSTTPSTHNTPRRARASPTTRSTPSRATRPSKDTLAGPSK